MPSLTIRSVGAKFQMPFTPPAHNLSTTSCALSLLVHTIPISISVFFIIHPELRNPKPLYHLFLNQLVSD